MGCVVITWNIIIGGGFMVLLGFGMNPESTAFDVLIQGVVKAD